MADEWQVTVVDDELYKSDKNNSILDIGSPAITNPFAHYGLGGTTNLWHNGLIEIENSI